MGFKVREYKNYYYKVTKSVTVPKEKKTKRNIWTAETLFKALDVCDDNILSLALNLAFSCSLRMGEMLGLTWDCIDISRTSIEQGGQVSL